MIALKSSREIEIMRESCQLAARTLEMIAPHLKPGISTLEINDLCHDFILSHDAYPSPLNYKGFPKSVCTSLNEVICHGIPSSADVLKDGDILNIDVTTYFRKFHGDTNRTFLIGEVRPEVKAFVAATEECLAQGIETVKSGAHLGDIGAAIQKYAEKNGYSVVRDYCGHGIGREFHEDPQILHYGQKGQGMKMKSGMTFTIEPMINMGKPQSRLLKDGWTAVTADGRLSAQFEHTVLVTDSGHDILTKIKSKT